MSETPTYWIGPEPDDTKVEAILNIIISWYQTNGRDLPWRRTRDPWRVLVSEVMLQQIQVRRAVPFYEAFVERFPTARALAEAPLSEAIRVWGDLGRYRRVASLHKTARILVDDFGGEVPPDPGVLVKLPGIGPYTAGAVACFAFEEDVAFVDTNVRRVLHRLFYGADVPGPAVADGEILRLAKALVPRGRGWEWGQAIIEFGAIKCTARKPLCESCPLSGLCAARPTIWGLISTQPRATDVPRKYEGSNRYYRGRVLAKLRDAPREGVTINELGEGLRKGFSESDLSWLAGIVGSLEKDGLVTISSAGEPPQSVTEERASYGVDGSGDLPPAILWVRLP